MRHFILGYLRASGGLFQSRVSWNQIQHHYGYSQEKFKKKSPQDEKTIDLAGLNDSFKGWALRLASYALYLNIASDGRSRENSCSFSYLGHLMFPFDGHEMDACYPFHLFKFLNLFQGKPDPLFTRFPFSGPS